MLYFCYIVIEASRYSLIYGASSLVSFSALVIVSAIGAVGANSFALSIQYKTVRMNSHLHDAAETMTNAL